MMNDIYRYGMLAFEIVTKQCHISNDGCCQLLASSAGTQTGFMQVVPCNLLAL